MKRLAAILCLSAALASAQVRLPKYDRDTLPNGMVVILAPKHDVPLITLRAVIRGGAESESAEKAGLAALTAELLQRGAGKRSAEEFAQQLDFMGAELNLRVDNQSTTATLEFLSKDSNQALDLFGDALLHPQFAESEFTKAKAERVAAAQALKDNPSRANAQYARAFFFGPQHPYGHPADELTLARITRADVLAYHQRFYAARNMFLVAVGDFEPAALRDAVRRTFSPAPEGQAYSWRDAPPPAPTSPRLLLVDKPDATQTYFGIYQPGINRTSPDRVPLLLVNTLFGDRFTSILNDELRVNSGLTYGASSRIQTDRLTGSLSIVTFTKTETTEKAITLSLDLLKRLRDRGITPDQLKSAKAYVKGIYPTEHLETADQLAQAIGDIELFGLTRGEVDDLFSSIDAVTPEQATAIARKYYRSDNLQFVLTGNAAKIKADISRYAPTITTVPISAPGIRVTQ